MKKIEKINYVKKLFGEGVSTGASGFEKGLNYYVPNKELYFDFDGKTQILSKNDLADKPEGVGDIEVEKICSWVQKKYS